MRNFELNYPNKIIRHLESLSTEMLFLQELESLKTLQKSFPIHVIANAVESLSRNGIPPYGKLSLYPLTDLQKNPDLLNLFSDKPLGDDQVQQAMTSTSPTLEP